MLSVSSVQRYLRQQHVVLSNILSDMPPSRTALPSCGDGSVSPDCTLHAALGPDNRLHVRNLGAGHLVHAWALPPLQAGAVHYSSLWAWTADSQTLVIPCGDAWRYLAASPAPRQADLLFLNVATGVPLLVHLPSPQGDQRLHLQVCSPRSRLLAIWSCAQPVGMPLQVYDCQGALLAATHLPRRCRGAEWAPSGLAIALHVLQNDSRLFWVWDLSTGSLVQMESAINKRMAWATPSSSRLALLRERSSFEVTFEGVYEHYLTCTLPQQQTLWQLGLRAWGARLVFLAGHDQVPSWRHGCSPHLQFHSLQGNQLSLQTTVTAGQGRAFAGTLSLSADGQLGAMLTGTLTKSGQLTHTHLAIVHLSSGRLREHPLLGAQPGRVCLPCWRADNAAVLVSSLKVEYCELFSFDAELH